MAYGGFQGLLLSLEPPLFVKELEVLMPSEVYVNGQLVTVTPGFDEGQERVPAAEMTPEERALVEADAERERRRAADAAAREAYRQRQLEINNEIIDCYDCMTEIRRGDAYVADWDSEARCEDCYYEREEEIQRQYEEEQREDMGDHINYYSYRPNCVFHDVDWNGESGAVATSGYVPTKKRLYMGFELEVEVNEGSRGKIADDLYRTINRVDGKSTSLAYMKEDGSLSYGFEIVTHPCSMDFYHAYFPWHAIDNLREQGVTAWNSRSCGLHIHMSRDAFIDERHLWKFIVFIYKNPEQLIQFAGRNSSYARFSRENFLNFYDYDRNRYSSTTFMSHAKGKSRNDDRYTAVNLQPVATIELRFFRPSLRTNTVKAALEFCAALHEYTGQLNTKEVLDGALKWPKFREWVAGKAKYNILDGRIAERFDESSDH